MAVNRHRFNRHLIQPLFLSLVQQPFLPRDPPVGKFREKFLLPVFSRYFDRSMARSAEREITAEGSTRATMRLLPEGFSGELFERVKVPLESRVANGRVR